MTAPIDLQASDGRGPEELLIREAASPIKVANLILEYHPVLGGAQRQLQMLAPLLKAEGVDLSVLTRRYPHLGVTVPFERVEGVPVHRLPAPGGRTVASAAYTASALLKLRAERPDVIHAYSLFSPLTIAMTARQLFRIPVVVKVLRGGALGDVDRIFARSTSKQRIAAFQRNVDAFIVISKEIDGELDGIGIRPEQRVFIPNGVDTERFQPLPAGEKAALRRRLNLPSGPLVLYTGRLVAEKRIDLLILAWEAVQSRHPEASLLILGTGDQEAVFKQKAAEQGAGQGIHFLGQIPNVSEYLQAGDLFVLPSVTEGLSNSLLEAMAAGLPSVSTRVGAAPDLITHGESGWLIPPDDEQALCEALLALLPDPSLRENIGVAARNHVVQNYSLPSVAKRIRHLYDRVTARA